ncbi:MAG: hypothetical protein M1839_007983 [Geoglossum umbratile]|nr:MAG: hypothetical protein M1839_007983 [Geoglossum umbratile]
MQNSSADYMLFDTSSERASLALGPDVITLQVGDRRFITTKDTLTDQCGFFSSMLPGRWNSVQPDGSYFVDADGDLFQYILRYLRRGVLPVFYDNAKGHDHALYLALLEEAKYFQIPRLEKWLGNKTYLKAVKFFHTAVEVDGADELGEVITADVEIEYHPARAVEKVYVCPRGIPGHRGSPSSCGKACRNTKGDAEDKYEDEDVLRVVIIRKRTVFDEQICIERR